MFFHALREPQQEVHRGGGGGRLSLSLWRPKMLPAPYRAAGAELSSASSSGGIGPDMPLKVVKLLKPAAGTDRAGLRVGMRTRSTPGPSSCSMVLEEEKSTSAVSPGARRPVRNVRDGEDYFRCTGGEGVRQHRGGSCSTTLWTGRTCSSRWAGWCRRSRSRNGSTWAIMKHCLRYRVGRRCCAWKFDYQEWPGKLVILTDADWASDSERRSPVGLCAHLPRQPLDRGVDEHSNRWCRCRRRRASSVASSAGGFGLPAPGGLHAVRLLGSTPGVVGFFSGPGYDCKKTGSGRVKHVEARYLWVQQRVRKKQFSVGSTDTSHNHSRLGPRSFHSGVSLAGADADDAHVGRRVSSRRSSRRSCSGALFLGAPGDAGAG